MNWRSLRLVWPFLVLLGVVAGYTVYWHVAAARVAEEIARWRATPGGGLSYAALDVGGFPFRIVLEGADVTLESPGATLTAERLYAVVQPYDFGHWIFQAGGRQSLRLRAVAADGTLREVTLLGTTAVSDASLIVDADGPRRFDLDLHRLAAALEEPGLPPRRIEALRAGLHLRRAAGGPGLDLVADLERLRLIEGFESPLGPDIARLRMVGAATPPAGSLSGALPAAALGPGSLLTIAEASIVWGDVDLTASGRLTLDAARRPEGRLDLLLAGREALVAALVRENQLRQADGELALQVLGLLAAAGGDAKGRVPVPLILRDGGVFVGPQRIGDLAPLF